MKYYKKIFFFCFAGVSHRSAELVLVTALRSFVEDLLRKCSGNKLKAGDTQRYDCNCILNLVVNHVRISKIFSIFRSKAEINEDDVLHTISTIQQFDFLTNKNFGIDKKNIS